MKAYKFRLYPSEQIEQKLLWTLNKCRLVYNDMLEGLNKQNKPNRYELQAMLPKLKKQYPELKNVHSKAIQYEVYRLFSNLRALVQLKKKGKKVGRLRFKARGWFKTFVYNQSGFKIILTDKRCKTLRLSKIGDIPIRMHRNIKGTIKQITVKRYNSGKWFASLLVEQKVRIKQHQITKAIGIDMGLIHFTMDSDGKATSNPYNLKKSLKKLRRENKRFSRTKLKSNNHQKQRIKLARIYEKVVNQRDDFLHKLSYAYVNNYDFIAYEDLKIPNMVRNHYLAGSILDASWSKFIQILSYKAENAGKIVMKVDPRNTSQRCSRCGRIVEKNLAVRTHRCPYCGLVIDRDYNSAIDILKSGLENYRRNYGKSSLSEIESLLSNEHVWSRMQEAHCFS